MAHAHKKNAFSLIELAVVLVIIGLLAGGVLTGQSLIRNAELQSVVSEVNQYKDAVAQFQSQYASLPGDMPDATDYWGVLAGSGSDVTCFSASGLAAVTCNGDGNGRLELDDQNVRAPEVFHAWKHLRNADLIQGQYFGARSAATYQATPGVNVPRSTLDDGGYSFFSIDSTALPTGYSGSLWAGDYNPVFAFGKETLATETRTAILAPDEAWNIDTKMDDGLPGLGKVRSYMSNTCNTNITDATTSEYALSDTAVRCAMLFSLTDPGT